MSGRIWLAWLHHRRNVELSRAFHAELYEFVWKGPPALRYSILSLRTVCLLFRKRPRIVFAQNPSLVLALLLAYCKSLLGFRLVVDTHNAGIQPMEGESSLLNRLARTVIRKSDLTLVTNEALLEIVRSNHGNGYVLPDPIPAFQNVTPSPKALEGERNVLFVCSFSQDEPYDEAIGAARLLEPDTIVYVTGDYLKAGLNSADLPRNVRLTGFVPEQDYVSLLVSADVVVDLTTRENCLVCGAYEAVAFEKPLVVSDTAALRRYFYKGTLYTRNSQREIAAHIRQALDERQVLSEQMRQMKQEISDQWSRNRDLLEVRLGSW